MTDSIATQIQNFHSRTKHRWVSKALGSARLTSATFERDPEAFQFDSSQDRFLWDWTFEIIDRETVWNDFHRDWSLPIVAVVAVLSATTDRRASCFSSGVASSFSIDLIHMEAGLNGYWKVPRWLTIETDRCWRVRWSVNLNCIEPSWCAEDCRCQWTVRLDPFRLDCGVKSPMYR